ncbi:MAG TPA: FAD-binding oxidoreductase [Dongiaceae bacterium]|nr:FAD-binding oxidoreductase [Dongiaceae bacterium]
MAPQAPNPTKQNQFYPFGERPMPFNKNGKPVNPAVIPLHDVSPLPDGAKFVVVGAGIHGLSTAYHLAKYLTESGKGKGSDVVLIDKAGPGAGATGLACGCVRNLYMTKPLHAILRESVKVWKSDPVNFGFQQVGYVSVGESNQESDYVELHKSQNDQGYPSDMYVGKDAKNFLKTLWPDFNTDKADVVLHEKPSGYAGTHMAVWGLDQKCMQYGVRRCYGPEVIGYEMQNGRVTAVKTDKGDVKCDTVVIGAGAWTPKHWEWLGKANKLDLKYKDGRVAKDHDMWTYWRLLEGEVFMPQGVDFRTAADRDSPVLHVELMNTPVVTEDGKEFKDKHFYMYARYAAERVGAPGIQGGTIPVKIGGQADVEPYGHLSDKYQAEDWFADYYCATLSFLFGRFKGSRKLFKERRNGGIGAFTPDNVPVFDWAADNAWMIADSNHGFKMIGVGELSARHLLGGPLPDELKPFSLKRYADGWTYGGGNSNCPWV